MTRQACSLQNPLHLLLVSRNPERVAAIHLYQDPKLPKATLGFWYVKIPIDGVNWFPATLSGLRLILVTTAQRSRYAATLGWRP